jgi:hypothetical protein
MFRFAIAVLAVVGLVSLLGSASAAAVGIGWLVLAPLVFVFKIMLFFLIFGAIAQAVSHRGGPGRGRGWDHRRNRTWGPGWDRSRSRSTSRAHRSGRTSPARDESEDNRPADEERFEEWHRMQHARKEVDSWVEIPETPLPPETRENH